MKSNSRDLIFVILLTLAAMLLALVGLQSSLLRLIVMAPLVFFLPGYAIAQVIYSGGQLDAWERVLMSLGISLMVTIISGILLDRTPFGLQTVSWSVVLGGITLIAAVIALKKRQAGPAKELPRLESRVYAIPVLLFAGAVILTAGAFFFARTTTNSLAHTFTVLWLTPVDKSQPNVLQVGVTNMENSTINYRLTVQEGGKVLEQFPSIQLQPGNTWKSEIKLSNAGTGPVTANLYRLDDPSKIYRTATWWPSSS